MFKRLIACSMAFFATLVMAAVDVNKASQAELTEVKGIGPATATRITDARKLGPFKNWEDFIQRVKGIAETSAAKLSDNGLTVNGQPFRSDLKPSAKPNPANDKNAKPTQTASKKTEKS